MRCFLLFGLVIFTACPAHEASAGWFGPSTYRECILDKMKGQNQGMALMVADMCYRKFACNAQAKESYRTCAVGPYYMNEITVGSCMAGANSYCSN